MMSRITQAVKGVALLDFAGAFGLAMKYLVAPSSMPDDLTWFKWEAYFTWVSGFSLLVLVAGIERAPTLRNRNSASRAASTTPEQCGFRANG